MPWTIRIALIVGLVLVSVSAVGLWNARPQAEPPRPAVLRCGVLPGRPPEELKRRFLPLLAHMSKRAGVRCELVIPADYGELVSLYRRGEVDLAWFGALTFLQAQRHREAVPLVMRDVDAEFTTVFIVRPEHVDSNLAAMQGLRFGFGNRLSTSGHLMARHHLSRVHDIEDPETYFDGAHHHQTHDETAQHVRDGRIDVGAINALELEAMYRSGVLSPDEVMVLERSHPYVAYLWVAHADVPTALRSLLREALLELDPIDDEHKELLEAQQCRGFLPVHRHELKNMRSYAAIHDLLGDDA
ncbi:MAG: phosphate/phosphite/phosphonate ABC transporter substrate-binding protein [Planctomycetota bacterium]|nr:phosphate/phosphite/phosphonate ABC transporter substrate-binding protein [Planctomycetota bacterium]